MAVGGNQPTNNMKEIIYLNSTSLKSLEREVNEYLKKGYELYGTVVAEVYATGKDAGTTYIQAVTKGI
jgi:hypothetical protein